MFTALFTIAKIWKQPKIPSTDGWKMLYVYITFYHICTLYTHTQWNTTHP